jgi:hypothetical protein
VTVTANILGVPLISSMGGRELRSRIAKIDNNTKQMVIYVDGQQVKTMPVSLGREQGYQGINGQWYDWRTPSGVMA